MNLGVLSELKGQAWKLATFGTGIVGTAVAVGLGVCLLVEKAEHAKTEADRADLYSQIYTPKTGYLAQVTQLRTNYETCSASLVTQNAAIEKLAVAGTAALAEAERKLDDAQEQSRRANARVAEIMKPLVGTDTCQRSVEIYERIKKDLK